MLYEAIRLGCQKYHEHAGNYDEAYISYGKSRNSDKWNNPDSLDLIEVWNLIEFANKLNSHFPYGSVRQLLCGLKHIIPNLNRLQSKTLLDIRVDEVIEGTRVTQLIIESFDAIAKSNHLRRNMSTATSKMLHAAANPELFVMWDESIRSAYRVLDGDGYEYAVFLMEMKHLAKDAISQAKTAEGLSHEDAIASLTPCGNTLAKVIDEFNYTKFRLKDKRVWEAERRT